MTSDLRTKVHLDTYMQLVYCKHLLLHLRETDFFLASLVF